MNGKAQYFISLSIGVLLLVYSIVCNYREFKFVSSYVNNKCLLAKEAGGIVLSPSDTMENSDNSNKNKGDFENGTSHAEVQGAGIVSSPNLFIFYFVFIPTGVEHWVWLVTAQLKDLKATGLLDVASLTVIGATNAISPTADEDIMSLTRIVKEIAGTNATVTPRYENRYEYWGLYPMWEKAMSQNPQQRKDSVFLYMHSKGMVNHGKMTQEARAKTDGPLFKHVIEPWRDVLFRFKTVPQLDKAGFVVTSGGYVYYNYIWARSSYVARLEAPVERPTDKEAGGGPAASQMKDVSRYYYEHWIAHTTDQPPTSTNGWSMVLDEFKLGVCFGLEGTLNAFNKRDRKTSLGDDGPYNCTDRNWVYT